MTTRTIVTSIAASLALLACRTPTTEDQLDTVRSWTASVRLATAERSSRAINGATAAQLREQAQTALDDARSTLRGTPAVDSLASALAALDAGTPR